MLVNFSRKRPHFIESPFYREKLTSQTKSPPWVQRFPFSFPPKFMHSFFSKQTHRMQTVFISSHFKPVVTSVFVKGKTQNMGFVKPKIGDIPRSNVVLLCFSALLRQNLSFPFHVIHRRGCFFQEGEVGSSCISKKLRTRFGTLQKLSLPTECKE